MLHITNGDSTAISLRRSGIPGVFLAWRDVLHDGPVPAGLTLEQLSEVRARFLAERGWSSYEDALEEFRARDSILERFRNEREVVLWFEHDLYDQLQVLQILGWLAEQERGKTILSLIAIDSFPERASFHGLGELTPVELSSLFPQRRPITSEMLTLAHEAWDAFRSPDPTTIERVLAGDTSALPFLAGALKRHLQEFPSVTSGLSRTERQIPETLAAGPMRPVPLFVAAQRKEEAPFMGDWSFWQFVYDLSQGSSPLVIRQDGGAFVLPVFSSGTAGQTAFLEQELLLTEQGNAVLAGQVDWMQLHGIDRWLGGVHLSGHEPAWRWDQAQGHVVVMPPATP
jgi:Domain of unknown function (DUF1835)